MEDSAWPAATGPRKSTSRKSLPVPGPSRPWERARLGLSALRRTTVPTKSWNIRGVITHAAERLECFNGSGVPSRSWMKLRLRRVVEEETENGAAFDWLASSETSMNLIDQMEQPPAGPHTPAAGFAGEQPETVLQNERLDLLARKYFGNPALWRFIAVYNNIADPLGHAGNRVIIIPSLSALVKNR